MDTQLHWQGHTIRIETRLASQYFWLASETTVQVDGQVVARSGGFAMSEHAAGSFPHQDGQASLDLEIKGDWFSWSAGSYRLLIDGQPVAQGAQAINNWLPVLLVAMLAALCSCCGALTLLLWLANR